MARARSTVTTAKADGDHALLAEVMENFGQDERSHATYCDKVERWYKAYRAVLELRSKAAGWTSRQHPAHAYQIIETLLAGLVDPRPSWRVRSRPRIADPAEISQLRDGAKANELLLAQQADCDGLGRKQIVFTKQALIAGMSVYKTFWNFQEHKVPRQAIQMKDVLHPDTGQYLGQTPTLGVSRDTTVVADDNTAEVVDVRDFIWHEAAVSLEKAKRVTHRVLYTIEELRQLEKLGVYKDVDKLIATDGRHVISQAAPSYATREQDLFETDRAKDMVEVLEQWRRTDDGIRVTSVGNRTVLLRDAPNPFWHGRFPFIVCGAVPDLFRIPGISTMELVEDLQEIAWTLLNQRLDNTALVNNAIVLIRDDSDDYDQFEWAPGAQWVVQDPAQVSLLKVEPLSAEVSLQAEDRIKQDLQNIPGASPTLLGQIDQSSGTTATEVSLTTSLGQRRIGVEKQQLRYAHAELGEQWMANNQQFINEDRLVAVTGMGGAEAFQVVSPLIIQGDYYIDLEAMDESLVRQERQAEASSALQVMLGAAPVFAALSQSPGSRTPMLNMRAYVDDFLEARGISDKDRYFLPPGSSPPLQNPQQQPGQPGQQPSNGGVTAPQATDMNSPSNAASQSPAMDMQRSLAMSGGPSNAPNV